MLIGSGRCEGLCRSRPSSSEMVRPSCSATRIRYRMVSCPWKNSRTSRPRQWRWEIPRKSSPEGLTRVTTPAWFMTTTPRSIFSRTMAYRFGSTCTGCFMSSRLFEEFFENSAHAGHGVDNIQPAAKGCGIRQPPRVPAEMFAHMAHGFAGPETFNEQFQVVTGDLASLRGVRMSRRTAGHEIQSLPDQPGVAVAAPADHDCVAAGCGKHCFNALGIEQIPDADNRGADGPLELPQVTEVRTSGKALTAGPGMQRDRVDALCFGDAGNFQKVHPAGVPAASQLDRERSRSGFTDGPEHRAGPGRVVQQCAAGARANHLAHRTAEIDVDQVGFFLHHTGRISHPLRIFAEQLDCQRTLLRYGAQQFAGGRTTEEQPVGTDHFGENQPGPKPFHDQPIGEVADACHGGEEYIIVELESPDIHGQPA